MRAYSLSNLGYANTGSEQSNDCRWRKVRSAFSGRGPRFQLESFFVSWISGDVIWAKFWICPRKKLQSPRNCLTFSGGKASLTAFSLSAPGKMPSFESRNPRYEVSLDPKTRFFRFTLKSWEASRVKTASSVLRWSSWVLEWMIKSSMYTTTLSMPFTTCSTSR